MVSTILGILSAAVIIYTILCIISIVMSWIPGAKFTKFGKFISSICDPWMNIFSRISWLRIGNIDFSPVISIGILSLLSAILGGITATGKIHFGSILAMILSMAWSVISSLIMLVTVLIFVRFIVLALKKGQREYGSMWDPLDDFLSKICYKIAGTFSKSNLTYQKSLLISGIILLVIIILGKVLIVNLANLLGKLPF